MQRITQKHLDRAKQIADKYVGRDGGPPVRRLEPLMIPADTRFTGDPDLVREIIASVEHWR